METVLAVENLSKSFSSAGHSIKALDSLTLNITKGEVFGLLGPNGAGKTTLISTLCGFLIPDKGKATIFGMDCATESGKIRKRINFVSGFGGISEFFTAEELLNFYCMLYDLDKPRERIDRALKLTDLEKHRSRMPSDFSSGLGRRFLISKALLTEPEVLLLDEPTVGLDMESALNLRDVVRMLKSNGVTILLTTHNMHEAEELCDRIALIRDGKIIACGTFAELKEKFFPHQVLEIQCKDMQKLEKLLSKITSLVRITKKDHFMKLYFKDKNDINAVLKMLASSGLDILSINTLEPELEDLYSKVMQHE